MFEIKINFFSKRNLSVKKNVEKACLHDNLLILMPRLDVLTTLRPCGIHTANVNNIVADWLF